MKKINCRVKISGSYLGENWYYEDAENEASQYIDIEDNDPSELWWTDGNFSCDCNRWRFLPKHLQDKFDELHGNTDKDGNRCGETIIINSIIPFDTTLPSLIIS